MKLYHYTGSEHVRGIQMNGIRNGGWLMPDGRSELTPVEWLTTDDNWLGQTWATMTITHCDRTEARFVVVIPKAHRNKLMHWRKAADQLGISRVYQDEVISRPGEEHWHVFLGNIPRGWLRTLELRPGVPAQAVLL